MLENKYGIAGYGFWFKLLEILGNSPGHHIDAKNIPAYEYLQAYTHTNEETCKEILDLLAGLEAIDPELWRKEKIIWSDNFLQGIAEAYRKRVADMPVKPSISGGNSTKKVNPPEKPGSYPQKREKKGEEKREREEKNNAEPGSDEPNPAFFHTCKFFDVDWEYRAKLQKEYPLLTDELLTKEFSRMEDWISDNRKKKKFKANGHLASPKNFIRNWLDRLTINPTGKDPGGGGYGGKKGNGDKPKTTGYTDLSE